MEIQPFFGRYIDELDTTDLPQDHKIARIKRTLCEWKKLCEEEKRILPIPLSPEELDYTSCKWISSGEITLGNVARFHEDAVFDWVYSLTTDVGIITQVSQIVAVGSRHAIEKMISLKVSIPQGYYHRYFQDMGAVTMNTHENMLFAISQLYGNDLPEPDGTIGFAWYTYALTRMENFKHLYTNKFFFLDSPKFPYEYMLGEALSHFTKETRIAFLKMHIQDLKVFYRKNCPPIDVYAELDSELKFDHNSHLSHNYDNKNVIDFFAGEYKDKLRIDETFISYAKSRIPRIEYNPDKERDPETDRKKIKYMADMLNIPIVNAFAFSTGIIPESMIDGDIATYQQLIDTRFPLVHEISDTLNIKEMLEITHNWNIPLILREYNLEAQDKVLLLQVFQDPSWRYTPEVPVIPKLKFSHLYSQ